MLGIKEIQEIIPHRYPMLLIDRVTELVEGVEATAYKAVSYNEPFFIGHYPEAPVMPGVLIIEALAQTGAVAILSKEENKGKLIFFGGINKAKFRDQVTPGCLLKLVTKMVKQKGPLGIGEAKAYVDDKLVAEAELTFFIK
ncbi:3-hydroxyacyl-ACP dehydratase FabZ [Anaeromicropila herbilytica]|uniref:3-hydroxyacyl-[acyl-carrier-protein] dehydratase FabZ n=1 Tax=Anaeromicropila herbilytica TaxID=2785025 RepID=A0A7R7EHB0_9FIRM|nr:3-hydroxyacyl-ACP dehydratase FabZ [Anaeromicropila herbilytica]BCN28723.1 3-hydroxyacyl-[acyl-carrier-protein] dehydratase FabZ [Anaeromicropila herbilytica]